MRVELRSTFVTLSTALALPALGGCGDGRSKDIRTDVTPSAAVGAVAERRVDIGGRSLFLACAGDKRPTVVIEMGFDPDIGKWQGLQLPAGVSGLPSMRLPTGRLGSQ